MRYAAGIGPPDVVKATCPVRGALGGNPLSRGSMDAVLRLHGSLTCCPAPQSFWMVTSLTLDEFQALVPPFEAAFQVPMAAWRLDGKPRTARRFSVYQNCSLP